MAGDQLDWFPTHPDQNFRLVPDNLKSFWRIEFLIMLGGNGVQEMRETFNLVGDIRYFKGLNPCFLFFNP